MGSIVSTILGAGGTNTAKATPVVTPISVAQQQQQYQNVQGGLQQQQNLVNALQGQGGIQNQGDVYKQMQGVASGQGPNPAQAMLANATGQNVANQAALMAGQRGAGSNVGLMARQIGQQGAGIQQNAAGQGAAMQANQSLNAMGQMGNIANQQVANQMGAAGAYTQNALAGQGQALGAVQGVNQTNAQNFATTAGVAAGNAQRAADLTGGLLGGAAQASGLPMKAEGGAIHASDLGPRSHLGKLCLANGGKVPALLSPGEKYLSPQDLAKVKDGKNPMDAGKTVPGKAKVGGDKNDYANDTVKASLDEGGVVLPRSVTQGSNPRGDAAKFVASIESKKGKK